VELAFWLAAAVVLYAYLGYPALILLAARLRPAPEVRKGEVTPSVSVVIVARNEEACLEEKLKNLLDLDYPRDRLEVIAASDGSTDRTEAIAAGFASEGVRLLALPGPRGKAAALNEAVAAARGEVLVLTDARQPLARDAVRQLVSFLADPSVGAVSVESLKPLVEQWLGALPSTGRKETFKDVGMNAPGGVIEKTVRKGVEPKAQTLAIFTGETTFDPASRYAMRSLAELLEMKLLENLREALGGTYSVSASGSLSKYPKPEYQFSVNYGSSPDKAELLWKTVLAVIDTVKRDGATPAELQKVREQQLRTQEVSLKENSYWAGNISARLENGEDPRGLATYTRDYIEKLTSEQIRDAARRYLDLTRYARFVLLPEKIVP